MALNITPRFYARLQHGFSMEAKFETPTMAAAAATALAPVLGYLPVVECYVNGQWIRYDQMTA
jgi:hypothetical protein